MSITPLAKDLNGIPLYLFRYGNYYNIDGREEVENFLIEKDMIVRAIAIGDTRISLTSEADDSSILFPDGLTDYLILKKGTIISVLGGIFQITECH